MSSSSSTSTSASASASAGVKKVYKILETAKSDPRYLFPVPIPASHEFFLPPLDLKDGFVHLSTAQQLPGTLNRFFAEHSEVVLLKIDYARLAAFKRVKWEQASNGDTFPHLYGAGIEGEYVDSFKELKRVAGASAQGEKGAEASWNDVLEDLKKEGWLQA